MNIVFVSAECAPFSATGGLGEVVGSLPKEISSLGHKVSVVLPYYSLTREKGYSPEHIFDIPVKLSWRNTGASVYFLERDGVDYYFLENSYYFDRAAIYGEFDDAERFAFFSYATLELIKALGISCAVLHLNDWHTALISVLLKTVYKNDESLRGIKTLYTIHNIEYQGIYSPDILTDVFGIEESEAHYLSYDGKLNLTKGALVTSDLISTVSENYRSELSYDFYSFGLSEVINQNGDKLFGVINGIDYEIFSPERENAGFIPYTKRSFRSGKRKNKEKLLSELGLLEYKDCPLLVMITRLARQKGIDLLLGIIEELLSLRVTLVILGSGEKEYEERLSMLDENYGNFRFIKGYDKELSLLMYAGADMLLMPSRSEPCGIAQMIACSFGTVPVVRSVGGLKDTVTPFSEDSGVGFLFENYNAHELLFKIKDALTVYSEREKWNGLISRCMKAKFDWKSSAEKYISIYKKIQNYRNEE